MVSLPSPLVAIINNACSSYLCVTAAKECMVQIFVSDYVEHLCLFHIYILEVKSGVFLSGIAVNICLAQMRHLSLMVLLHYWSPTNI